MTHINQRNDTAANWVSANPVLEPGEVGWESDTRKSKLGDGATPWNGLSYTVTPLVATKADIGLDQVDNTSDADKPLSSAATGALSTKAPLDSPALTGTPTAPTPLLTDADTSIATTAFVAGLLASSSLPAYTSTTLPDHREGLAIYVTDTDTIWVSDGVNWNLVWAKVTTTTNHIRLRRTAVQALGSGVTTTIAFDTIVESTGEFLASPPSLPATNIAVPLSGLWEITVTGSNDSSAIMLHVLVNAGSGSKVPIRVGPSPNTPTVATATIIKQLNVGDSVNMGQFVTAAINTFAPPYAPELTLRYLGRTS